MKVLAILGSRNQSGQTARAAEALLEGVRESGGQGDCVYLPEHAVERCRQCEESGWGRCLAEGRCVIDDGFAALVARIAGSDLVVFATPVYFGDLSESMRALLDRLRRVCMHEEGKKRVRGKPAVVLCVAGGGGGGAPACAVSLTNTLLTCGFDVVDVVPARRQNLELKLAVLRTTGGWLAGASHIGHAGKTR